MTAAGRGVDPLIWKAFEAQSARLAHWLADVADGASRATLVAVARLVQRDGELAAQVQPAGRGVKAQPVGVYLSRWVGGAPSGAASDVAAGAVAAMAARLAAWDEAVHLRLANVNGDPVLMTGDGAVRASDLLRTRVLALTAASVDDPGASPGPGRDRQAVRVCCRLLAEVLAERHPGRSIEVRIPPYAAVQIGGLLGPGPTHTRGTPPNVVECGPEVFLAVATGRRPWADAVAAGEVRESGARADLAPYLPLV